MLLGGLKSLHVYSNTGQGRSMGSAARDPVRAAWKAREEVLTAAHRRQLEGFADSSRNFKALLEEGSPSQQQPVRRDYVPAPRPQTQQKERKQKQRAGEGEDGGQPQLSKRQLKRLQAQQRADEIAAARAAAEQQAAVAAPPPSAQQRAEQAAAAVAQQRRAGEELEAANGKRFKLTIRLGSGSLAAAAGAPQPGPTSDERLAASIDDHWRWHEQQQQQQEEAPPPLPPMPPPDDAAGGWQTAPALLSQGVLQPPVSPMSPMSSNPASPAAAPLTAAARSQPAANGSALAPRALGLGLSVEAVEHAASGSPAIRELLG